MALDSTGFMSWGEAGKGQWVTIYAKGSHAYMVVAGLRFDTSGRADAEHALAGGHALERRLHRPPPRRSLNRGQGKGGTACAAGGPGVQLVYPMAARPRCSLLAVLAAVAAVERLRRRARP